MNTSFSQDALALVKSVALMLLIIAPTVMAAEFAYKNPDILFLLLDRVQTLEIGNTKIAFGEKAFALNPDLKSSRGDQAAQWKIVKRLQGLGPFEVDRLLHLSERDRDHLGDDDLHCDYDSANSRMRLYAAADQGLFEKLLVERIPRPDLTRRQRDRATTPSENGYPSNCYQMVLTKDGSDLKSVIVSEMTRFFGNGSEPIIDQTSDKAVARKTKEEASHARYEKSAALLAHR